MSVEIDTFVLGPLETNSYLVRCDGESWVIDPGMWPGELLAFLAEHSASPGRILLTHGHGDHIAGIDEILRACPQAKVLCPAGDADMLTDPSANMSACMGLAIRATSGADELVQPGMAIELGGLWWQVLDTSGHTPGGVSFYCPDEGVVFTGDALFASSIGRTDIPGADGPRQIRNIRENLLSLPDETRVLPGHGPATTIARERNKNPFLMEADNPV